MDEMKKPCLPNWIRRFMLMKDRKEEPTRAKSWIKYGKTYKCGNCGKITYYIDIMVRTKCYNCDMEMKWAEGENGELLPLKFRYSSLDEAPVSKWEVY